MKERGIVFSGPMVPLVFLGLKTQTRRIVDPQPIETQVYEGGIRERIGWKQFLFHNASDLSSGISHLCPYGQIGDVLWVREAFQVYDYISGDYGGPGELGYPLKGSLKQKPPDGSYCILYRADDDDEDDGPWRSARFMPRWASRIKLQITNIRAERVQDITGSDALAEGFTPEVCADVFSAAAAKTPEPSDVHWFEDEEDELVEVKGVYHFCEDCAARIAKRHKRWHQSYHGGAIEDDGPAYCACGRALCVSLTTSGIEYELRQPSEQGDLRSQIWPATGNEARVMEQLAGGIGNLRMEHHGRLAQIGFATYWDHLNAKRGHSWASNPWVWVTTFRLLNAIGEKP